MSLLFVILLTYLALKIINKKYFKIILFIFSILIFTGYNTINLLNYNKSEKEIVYKKVNYKSVKSGEKQEFTKKAAIEGVISLLKDVQNENMSVTEQINQIKENKNINDIIPKNAFNRIYLTDFMVDDNVKVSTATSLLSFVDLIEKNGNKDIKPLTNDYNNVVYLDENSKTAQVPVNIFTGTSGSISFEMIYIDDEWKLSPYSLLESLSLSSQIQQQITNNQE
jgi:hypothetical protein